MKKSSMLGIGAAGAAVVAAVAGAYILKKRKRAEPVGGESAPSSSASTSTSLRRSTRLHSNRRRRHSSPVDVDAHRMRPADDSLNVVFKNLKYLTADADAYFLILQLSEIRRHEPRAYDKIARHLNDLAEILSMVEQKERLSLNMLRISADVITTINDELRVLEKAFQFFNAAPDAATPLPIQELQDYCKDAYFNISQYIHSTHV